MDIDHEKIKAIVDSMQSESGEQPADINSCRCQHCRDFAALRGSILELQAKEFPFTGAIGEKIFMSVAHGFFVGRRYQQSIEMDRLAGV